MKAMNKTMDVFGAYGTNLQQQIVWFKIYLEKHKQLNITQHTWVALETSKEIGEEITQLEEKGKQLLIQLHQLNNPTEGEE
jgi:hypothetical protein|tara:strand:- start:2675 stop:2917 length:243 start_codon:yes stop_codon:yes gene_type:complete